MKKTFKSIFLSSLVVLSLSLILLLAGCKKKTTLFVDQGEVGEYFSSALSQTASLSLDENSFTLTVGSETLTGVYSFDGSNLVLTFEGDTSNVSVNFGVNQVSFTYKGETYTLYRKVNYTVSFNTNGGSTVQSQQVQNGQKATKPADPTKAGYKFIGWYKDSSFTKVFDFNQEIITADTILYANYGTETSTDDEFVVQFVTGVAGVTVEDTYTFHKTMYNLPVVEAAGKTFAGWWVSDYEDSSKLTYKFEAGMELTQDTVLYAVFTSETPLVSVVGNKIEWDSKGVGKSYTVSITKEGDTSPFYTKNVSTTSDTYNFANELPGNYVVEVSSGNNVGRAYFVNKGLEKVSKFSVEGFVLTWNRVQNATDYKLTIDNGGTPVEVPLGDENSYDFSNVEMAKDGINFTVTASANNYASSSSKVYNVTRALAAISAVNYVSDGQKLTWDAVTDAESYQVVITVADGNPQTFNVRTTELVIDNFYGNFEYSVTPVKVGYYSEAKTGALNKTDLATPKNIAAYDSDITWDQVPGATSYIVKINGQTYNATTNKYTLSGSEIADADEISVSVIAVAADASNNSLESEAVTIRKDGITQISYANGTITWNTVIGTAKYSVKVDDGQAETVTNTNKLDKVIVGGRHTIYVAPVYGTQTPSASDYFSYQVDVYTVTFNTTNSDAEVEPSYFVVGDEVPQFASPQYNGYTFRGWYQSAEAAASDGQKFNATTFTSAGDITVYAGWDANTYDVALNYTDLGVQGDGSQSVVFGTSFNLPVPKSNSPLKAFYGWYSEINGQGIRYTDQTGASRFNWRDATDTVTLYAGWVDVFKFALNGNETAYAVSASEGALYLDEVTIPSTYNGKPVETVESYAFKDYENLVKINIPNSISNIETGNDGPNGIGSAFKGCSNLEGVYIYSVDGVNEEDVKYSSFNGSLVFKNADTTEVDLRWVPYGTTKGVYTIPNTVTSIPINTFQGCTGITGVVIPASVTTINEAAFVGAYNIETVEFLLAAEGQTEKALNLGANIFGQNSLITEINFPKRVDQFSADTLPSLTALMQVNFIGEFEGAKFKSVDGVVYSADGTKLIYFPRARDDDFVIPTGVTTVATKAFQEARYLKSITIPGHVTTIEDYAFKTCSRLSAINFQGTATDPRLSIGVEAFYNAGNFSTTFTELVLPANLKTLGKSAFGNMVAISSVRLNSVDENLEFASGAFGSNVSSNPAFYITHLWMSKDVHTFNVAGVFGATRLEVVEVENGNEYFTVIDGVLYNSQVTAILYYPTQFTGAFTLPATITTIGDRVFEEKKMPSITIPNTVTTIGAYAFFNCPNLETITFVDGGTSPLTLGDYAFAGCKNIPTITLPDRVTTIGNRAFEKCTSLNTINIGKNAEFTTETATITIGRNRINFDTIVAFEDCTSLTAINVSAQNAKYLSSDGVLCEYIFDGENNTGFIKVDVCPIAKTGALVLPNTVKVIEYNAFNKQKGVTSISFADGVTSLEIKQYAFRDASGLTSISLPSVIQTIESYTFSNCRSLASITIPKSVTSIKSSAFTQCTGLTAVNFEGDRTSNLVFEDGDYKGRSEASGDSSEEEGAMDPISIFAGCNLIEELVLPEKTTSIGVASFGGMMGLRRVSFPSTLKTIGDWAFVACQNLETVTFANGTTLENIGQGAFRGKSSYNPTKLQSINLPGGQYAIGDGAFKYTSLTNVVVPAGVTEIGKYAFYSDQLLTSVSLPTSLIFVREYAFSNDTALTTVTIANGATLQGVGAYAFKNTGVTSITFPATIYQIGQEAFYNCTDLATVTFALNGSGKSNLAQIGTRAFANTAITSFTFPESVDTEGASINIALGGNVTLVANGGGGSTEELHCPKCDATVTKDDKKCPECGNELHFEEEGLKCPKCGATVKEGQEKCPECGMELKTRNGEEEEGGEGGGSQGGGGSSQFISAPSYLFEGCKKLTTLQLSSSVISIDCMLVNCPVLTTVTVASGNPNLKVDATNPIILNLDGTAIRNVYGKLTGTFNIPDGITQISSYAFAGQTEMTKVIIPNTVVEIGEYAFKDCINLQTVEFASGSTLSTINNYLFKDCKSLTTINLPNSVTSIGNYAFAGCLAMTTLPITANVTTVGDYAFANAGFRTVTVPRTITTFGNYVFAFNPYLTTVALAEGSTCGPNMFANNKALTSVTIANGTTYLGEGMFKNCVNLETITIPYSVTRLGGTATTANDVNNPAGYVFDGCTKLATVNFETGAEGATGLLTIGSYAFRNCTSLTTFTIPDSVQNLGEHIFDSCTSLESCTLSNTGIYVPQYMFYNCTSLKSISMPESVIRIGGTHTTTFGTNTVSFAFYGCTSLETVEFSDDITGIGTNSFFGCTSLEEVTLPSKLQRVLASSFENCTGLKTVTFTQEAALSSLGNYLFKGCSSLETVNGFKGNTSGSLGYETFNGCSSLTSLTIPTNTLMTGNGVFMNCTSLTTIDFSSTRLYQIGSDAFNGCTNLTTVLLPATFPSSVSTNAFTFAATSFMNCTSLEEITLPFLPSGKVFNFGNRSFYGSGLRTLHLPSSVAKYNINNTTPQATSYGIDYAAFNNCPNLVLTIDEQNDRYVLVDNMFIVRINDWQSKQILPMATPKIVGVVNASGDIVIPDGYQIEQYAFSGCENVTSITLPASLTTIPSRAFSGYKGGTIIIPEGVTSIASFAFEGVNVESIVLPSTITNIDSYAFQGCTNLKSITLPEGVTTIGGYLFQGCTSLETVNMGSNITSIGDYAFQGCTSLTSFTIPETVTSIGNFAFEGTGLTAIVIPETVTTIGSFYDGTDTYQMNNKGYVFANCVNLTTVTYNASSISSKHMFDGCTSLTTITFASPLTQIDGYAFYNCSSLTSFTFAEGLKSIGAYAFSGTGLTQVTLPQSLTRLCDGAFANCTSLTSVTFGNGLKYLGSANLTGLEATSNTGGVFEGCTSLTTITLPNSLYAINGYAFAGCTSIRSIVIPESVSFVGDSAFAGWTANQTVNSVQTEYTITGLWEYDTTENGLLSYKAASEATFVYGYTVE